MSLRAAIVVFALTLSVGPAPALAQEAERAEEPPPGGSLLPLLTMCGAPLVVTGLVVALTVRGSRMVKQADEAVVLARRGVVLQEETNRLLAEVLKELKRE